MESSDPETQLTRCMTPFYTELQMSTYVADKRLQWARGLPVFYRAMLCIRGTSHGPVSVYVSVYVCLCLSQVGVVLKRLNVGSQ